VVRKLDTIKTELADHNNHHELIRTFDSAELVKEINFEMAI